MARHIVTFYKTESKENVNKINKFTKIITANNWLDCVNQVHDKYNGKFIKYIRDLENPKYAIYNDELRLIEDNNNCRVHD